MDERTIVTPGVLTGVCLRVFGDQDGGLDFLLGSPGFLPRGFDGLAAVLRKPAARLPSQSVFAFRSALLEQLASDLAELPRTPDWDQLVQDYIDRLQTKTVRVLHDTREPLFPTVVSTPTSSLVLSGPIRDRAAGRPEDLKLEVLGSEHEKVRRWLAERTERAEDISHLVRDVLAESWAGELVPPMDLYYKIVSEYFDSTLHGIEGGTDENPMLEHLTEFQREAYEHAKGILRRYGGVFLADVVGLGKSYIGLALLRHLQDRYDQHAVVVAPPKICAQWDELAAEFRVELRTVSLGKLTDLEPLSDREVLLVDESHNLRNQGTARYKAIQNWLRPGGEPATRRVILLSATPQNNDAADVHSQLALFPDNHCRLPFRGESLEEWFAGVRQGESSLSELLQHVVVRRTRSFVQRAYPGATLRRRVAPGKYVSEPLTFPTRVSGPEQCLRYSIAKAYGGDVFDRLMHRLSRMKFPTYGLGDYVTERGHEDSRLDNLRRTGGSLRGLFKVLLLKRLESSVRAFRITAERLASRLDEALERLEQGLVRVRLPRTRGGTDEDDEVEPWSDKPIDVPASLFDAARLRHDIEEDWLLVSEVLEHVSSQRSENDAKLQRLKTYLRERPPTEHPTIVFTQFADTAEYLGDALGQEFGPTACVTGSTGTALSIARRFAPRANRADIADVERVYLLISTDVLSEGVNLQDGSTAINFDLHWNPVRLIQRAGRIDRLGSEHDEIHVASFLPERELEEHLGLEAVLRRRVKEFLDVFGEDSGVLPSDELPDAARMIDAYTGAALEQADTSDDLDGVSRHVERLLRLRRTEPEEFDRIQHMRLGAHSLSALGAPSIAATRLGWFWTFWSPDASGKIERLSDHVGLDALFAHGDAGPGLIDDAPRVRRALMSLAGASYEQFVPSADLFRQQRTHPRLSEAEAWVLERLERYRLKVTALRRELVDEMVAWVTGGHAQARLRRLATVWRREKLAPEAVFNEVRPLVARFPARTEDLGPIEVAGAVVGVPDCEQS